MALLIIMIVVAVIATLGLVGVIIYNIKENNWHPANFAWTTLTIGIPMLCLLFGTFTKINKNEVGIVYDDRYGVVDKHFDEGFHKKSIFEHVTKISTLNRDKFIETSAQTDDGQYATFEIAVTYAVEKEDAPKYFRTTGGDAKKSLNGEEKKSAFDDQLMGLVEKELQSTTIKFNIFSLLSEGLETARVDFEKNLAVSLKEQYGITLRFAVFKDVDAGEKIEEILKAKATAEQQISIAQKEAEAKLVTATNEVAVAEKEAEQKKILADATAYATKVQGEASGEAASAYTDSILKMIDDLYVEQSGVLTYDKCANIILSIVFYDNWDGVLPTTLTSDSLSALIGALITGA
jgi:regulator of protease activity HflC (stomatin/prohibitin superfamily)